MVLGRRKKNLSSFIKEAENFFNHVWEDKPMLPFVIPLVLFAWCFERWIMPLSNWVLLAVSVWATIQYGGFQHRLVVKDLNKRWKRVILNTSSVTPLEHCEWLNKLLMEVWPNFLNPKLSRRFTSIVEKRLKHQKPRLLEKVELQEFSLGSCPPNLGLHGTRWLSSGDQRVMHMGFEWDANDVSIMLLAKLAKPLIGTARIVINSLHIKGDLILMPILDGQAVLYSFESTPEVRIGIAFGSGGSQSLPATELPGVSSWLVKLFTDTLVKTMVEPRRRCYSLPPVDLKKDAVGGILSVTVSSASALLKGGARGSFPGRQHNFTRHPNSEGDLGDKVAQMFVEVELGELMRRTNVSVGSDPRWDTTFNMVLHENTGVVRFHLYEWVSNNVKHDYISSCEIKLKYVADDSTTFWAIGAGSTVLTKLVKSVGQEVAMVVPFEGKKLGQLHVRLVLREWQFSDGSRSLINNSIVSQQSISVRTGRKLKITVVEGRNLLGKDKYRKFDPYIKLQYGKAIHRTRTILRVLDPVWKQDFEFDEIEGGEYLKVKCYSQDTFSDDNIGSARVNLEGLLEGLLRDIWVPLEKVNTGELRLQLEVVKSCDYDGIKSANERSGSGWIELVLVEARDLTAADLRGTSDPFVSVQYRNMKKKTKIVYRTLHPHWNQTLEFPDDGSPLYLHVKDYNALLPTSSIGHCTVEYQSIPPNQMADKWIPLQGVKKGEIHIQITRKVPKIQKVSTLDSDTCAISKARRISGQMRQVTAKLQTLIGNGDLEGLSIALNEVDNVQDIQEEYMMQLETEETLLLNKITEFGQELYRSTPSPNRNGKNIN